MEYSSKYFIIFLFLLLIPYYSVLHYEPGEAPKYAKSFLERNIEKTVEITKANKSEENIKFYVNAGSYWNKTSIEIETEILYKPKYIDEATDLIFGVKSEWKKRDRRDAVRNTYGNPVHYKKYGFTAKFVFLFGLPPNGSYLSELEEHDDIIVGDFHDSFQNLTYKDSMFFTWTYEAVPNLLFCYKGDDDILLNPFTFSEVLVSHKHVVDPVLWGNRGQGPRLGKTGSYLMNPS